MPEASLFVRKLVVKNSQELPLKKLVRNAQQRYGLEAQSSAALLGFGTEMWQVAILWRLLGRSRRHFLKPCKTFEATVLQNKSNGILSGL